MPALLALAGEFDAFLARAARGRNELELARRDEADKRQNRFRALVQVGPNLCWQLVSRSAVFSLCRVPCVRTVRTRLTASG
jgi:hypothetical protein